MSPRHHQRGQAAVELVAVLPIIVLIALAGWHVIAAAHAWTVSGSASRVAARAAEVGQPAAASARGVADHRITRVDEQISRDGQRRVGVVLRVPRRGWAPALDIVGIEGRVAVGSGARR